MGINAFIIEIDIISVLILLMVRRGISKCALQNKAANTFLHLVDLSTIFCILNSCGLFIPDTHVPAIRIVNCAKVVTCICMGCSWFLTVFYTTSANTYKLRKQFIPIALPSIIVSIFTITETLMHLSDGATDLIPSVWILLNILSILYILSASILCLIKARKNTNRFQRHNLYILSFAMGFPLFSLILQARFYEMPITSPAFAITILFLHLHWAFQRISVDELTGLNNTNKLSSYLESITQSQDPAKRLFFIKIEIDNFKARKKKHGKKACVVALQKLATFLREQSVQRGTFIARYGKATFAIVTECSDFAEIEAFANKLIAASASSTELLQGPWPITFSIHWSEYGTSETRTIDTFLDKAESNCIKPATPL